MQSNDCTLKLAGDAQFFLLKNGTQTATIFKKTLRRLYLRTSSVVLTKQGFDSKNSIYSSFNGLKRFNTSWG